MIPTSKGHLHHHAIETLFFVWISAVMEIWSEEWFVRFVGWFRLVGCLLALDLIWDWERWLDGQAQASESNRKQGIQEYSVHWKWRESNKSDWRSYFIYLLVGTSAISHQPSQRHQSTFNLQPARSKQSDHQIQLDLHNDRSVKVKDPSIQI